MQQGCIEYTRRRSGYWTTIPGEKTVWSQQAGFRKINTDFSVIQVTCQCQSTGEAVIICIVPTRPPPAPRQQFGRRDDKIYDTRQVVIDVARDTVERFLR